MTDLRERNYWTRRRLGRRTILKGSAAGAVGAAALVAVGCGDDDDKGASPTTAATAAGGGSPASGAGAAATAPIVPSGKLTIDVTSGGGTLQAFNPLLWTSGGQTPFRDAVADPMVGIDKKDQGFAYYAALAKSWERPADGLQVTFSLREDAKFGDGTPVTSEDIKFTLDFVTTDPARHARKSEWKRVYKTTETPDKQTAVVKLNEPYPLLLSFNFMLPVISKAAFDKLGFDGFDSNPTAAGPFKFVSGSKGERATLTAVEGHYRKTPFIKDLVIKATPEEATRLAQVETGETDIAYMSPTNKDLVKGFGGRVATTDNDTSFWLVFMDPYIGKTDSPANDPRVREAMSKAINRKDITAKLLAGGANPAGSIGNPAIQGHNNLTPDPYDLGEAKKILDAAGRGSGFQIDFSVVAPVAEYVNIVVADWKKIGIDATVKPLESGAWLAMVNAKKTPGLYIEPTGANYVDPAQWGLFVLSDGSFSYQKDATLDAKMKSIISGTDDKARAAAWMEVQKKIYDERIYSALWTSSTHFAVGKRVKQWDPVPGIGYIIRLEQAKV